MSKAQTRSPRFGSIVLDSQGLEIAARSGPSATRAYTLGSLYLKQQHHLVVSCSTLTEVLHGRAEDARVRGFLKSARLEPVDEEIAVKAAELLARAPKRAKEKSRTVDAFVCATAILRAPKPAVIATSDPEDIRALLGDAPGVAVLAV